MNRWMCGPATAWAGPWGALATGLFATKAVNPAGADGLFYGNPAQFLVQLVAAAVSDRVCLCRHFLIAKVLKRPMGLRVSETEEQVGLDISEHGERAYA